MKFELNNVEIENLKRFDNEHECMNKYAGAIGGRLSFVFTPTSIGSMVEVKCNICKRVEDITDYDCF